MLTKEEVKKFYPPLISRILLYLRRMHSYKIEVLTEELIEYFNKSKSIISQALSYLTDNHYIHKKYVSELSNHGSRHKISIGEKGLNIAETIISEGLDLHEKKSLALKLKRKKNRFRRG
ncbi:MAG: hypothetical protein ACFFEN_10695 [Candidatus Thorarchaeota archaeon]